MKTSLAMLLTAIVATGLAMQPAAARPFKANSQGPVGANVNTSSRQPTVSKEQRLRLLCGSGQLTGVACTARPIKKG